MRILISNNFAKQARELLSICNRKNLRKQLVNHIVHYFLRQNTRALQRLLDNLLMAAS